MEAQKGKAPSSFSVKGSQVPNSRNGTWLKTQKERPYHFQKHDN